MPARKSLAEYETQIGPISGVSAYLFDNARTKDYIPVQCSCGEVFKSKKADLAARFNRGNQVKCVKCVNWENIQKRYA